MQGSSGHLSLQKMLGQNDQNLPCHTHTHRPSTLTINIKPKGRELTMGNWFSEPYPAALGLGILYFFVQPAYDRNKLLVNKNFPECREFESSFLEIN